VRGWVSTGSPSNTMSPGPRPTSIPSGILIHPAVRPQYTNVTDKQTDRTGQTDRQTGQQSDSIGRTVLQTVAQKPSQNVSKFSIHVKCGSGSAFSDDNAVWYVLIRHIRVRKVKVTLQLGAALWRSVMSTVVLFYYCWYAAAGANK